MCGCGKKTTPRRSNTVMRASSVKSVSAGNSPGNVSQLRSLGLQAATPVSATKLDAERLRIEKLRRDAVRKALNK